MEAAPLPPAGEGGAKRRVRARRSRCGESVAALTTGAPGANALGGKCPPASACGRRLLLDFAPKDIRTRVPARSEEPTSELQSLMRISYAVFCLTKQHIYKPRSLTRRTSDQLPFYKNCRI